MSRPLFDAARQWAARSPDERFTSLDDLLAFTAVRKRTSLETEVPLGSLRVYATKGGAISVNGHLPPATLTNWAFSQLCQRIGAPAGYVRTLPPDIAATCLDYGVGKSSEPCSILYRKTISEGSDAPRTLAAAFTSDRYGRIWDHDVLTALAAATDGTAWRPPPSRDGTPSGLYASDRDMFVFLISDEPPIEVENARLSKGFFCWNSETGSATFGLTTFLFNHICCNGVVWDAEQVKELRIVHRHRAPIRFLSEAIPELSRLAEDRRIDDRLKDMVCAAMKLKIGETSKDVVDYLKDQPFTFREIDQAYDRSVAEGDDPTTLWGIVQGFTAVARQIPYADKRVNLERRAGALLH